MQVFCQTGTNSAERGWGMKAMDVEEAMLIGDDQFPTYERNVPGSVPAKSLLGFRNLDGV
jgi:hypothetical protein